MNKPVDVPVLLRERDGEIAMLVLNRPHPRNSLSEALLQALSSALRDIKDDTSVRSVVLAANGPAFCAGHDLKELTARRADADGGRAYFRHIMTTCSAMMQQIVTLPQPVIAAVQGPASAAGCQLVASCDLAVASDAAKFATPGVDIGLFCSTPMVALSRNVSRKAAMEMLLTGDMVEAKRAAEIGLVNLAVPGGELRGTVRALGAKLIKKNPAVLRAAKTAYHHVRSMSWEQSFEYLIAKSDQTKFRDPEKGDQKGMSQFIDEKRYRPGLETYDRKR